MWSFIAFLLMILAGALALGVLVGFVVELVWSLVAWAYHALGDAP